MTMTQKEAVFSAVTNVCTATDGVFSPTKEQRAQINMILFEGFKAGNIAYDGDLPADSELKAYVSGLQSNWLRKDKRLNGGVAYVAKNPGSRSGATDPQIRAMRALLATKTNPVERAEIQKFIEARLVVLKPAITTNIDVEALPEELRHLVG
jgi:hypothetical protein